MLIGVRCTSPAELLGGRAQEHNNGPKQDQVLHWNGAKWVVS